MREGGGQGGRSSSCVSVSSRCALSLLLLDPDQLQLFFALLVVCGQTLVLLQQLFVLLHQTGRVLLVLLILVQLSDELLPAQRADEAVLTLGSEAPFHLFTLYFHTLLLRCFGVVIT